MCIYGLDVVEMEGNAPSRPSVQRTAPAFWHPHNDGLGPPVRGLTLPRAWTSPLGSAPPEPRGGRVRTPGIVDQTGLAPANDRREKPVTRLLCLLVHVAEGEGFEPSQPFGWLRLSRPTSFHSSNLPMKRKRGELNSQGSYARLVSNQVPSPVGLRFHVVELKGIEPLFLVCQTSVLPLNYNPIAPPIGIEPTHTA